MIKEKTWQKATWIGVLFISLVCLIPHVYEVSVSIQETGCIILVVIGFGLVALSIMFMPELRRDPVHPFQQMFSVLGTASVVIPILSSLPSWQLALEVIASIVAVFLAVAIYET